MILIPKENVIRLEENKCIRKLEDLLDAEIKTLEKFINKDSKGAIYVHYLPHIKELQK